MPLFKTWNMFLVVRQTRVLNFTHVSSVKLCVRQLRIESDTSRRAEKRSTWIDFGITAHDLKVYPDAVF